MRTKLTKLLNIYVSYFISFGYKRVGRTPRRWEASSILFEASPFFMEIALFLIHYNYPSDCKKISFQKGQMLVEEIPG